MVRGSGEEDDCDEGREKLHTPVPGVNCHRSVCPLGYAWAFVVLTTVQHCSLLSPSMSFSLFIQISLSLKVSWSCKSYSHSNINLVTATKKPLPSFLDCIPNLNSLYSLINSNAGEKKKVYFLKCILLELSLRWFFYSQKKKAQAPSLLFKREVWQTAAFLSFSHCVLHLYVTGKKFNMDLLHSIFRFQLDKYKYGKTTKEKWLLQDMDIGKSEFF